MKLERVCVFCGSSAGEEPAYLDAAQRFGETLARRGIGLVYGGSSLGLMGRLASATLDAGGEVIGVIPHVLTAREVAHPRATEMRLVESMHERKSVMAELSDAFIALPGGLGTLEAFCELLTWGQLGLHSKPCGMLDVARYFRRLTEFFDHAAREGFLSTVHRDMVIVEADPETLLDRLAAYEPPRLPQWIDESET
ncbi:MAG: TIGR00730 family Rossman fold protein [Gemmatimonadetes bacterium]|nr:MAG: TIGR00730 family Rossman fold protein [Gemmatimonadota bacterium]